MTTHILVQFLFFFVALCHFQENNRSEWNNPSGTVNWTAREAGVTMGCTNGTAPIYSSFLSELKRGNTASEGLHLSGNVHSTGISRILAAKMTNTYVLTCQEQMKQGDSTCISILYKKHPIHRQIK